MWFRSGLAGNLKVIPGSSRLSAEASLSMVVALHG